MSSDESQEDEKKRKEEKLLLENNQSISKEWGSINTLQRLESNYDIHIALSIIIMKHKR